MIYLYLKTHKDTNLKYLGQTTQNPYKYRGSGVHWMRHIKLHGNNVSTEVLYETECRDELSEIALHYSKIWNITESSEFANLMEENGRSSYGIATWTHDRKIRHSNRMKGNNLASRIWTKNQKIQHGITMSKVMTGKTQGFRHRVHYEKQCPHCKTIGKGGNMTRYHFDNCKSL